MWKNYAGIIWGFVMTWAPKYLPEVYDAIAPYCFWGGIAAMGFCCTMIVREKIRDTKYVPMKEAAITAFTELKDTDTGQIALMLNKENPAGYYVHALAESVPIYGKRIPSTKLEALPSHEDGLFSLGFFSDDGSEISTQEHGAIYNQISVLRKDLRAYIKSEK